MTDERRMSVTQETTGTPHRRLGVGEEGRVCAQPSYIGNPVPIGTVVTILKDAGDGGSMTYFTDIGRWFAIDEIESLTPPPPQ